eukprot:145194-Amphidinium_carterae.1
MKRAACHPRRYDHPPIWVSELPTAAVSASRKSCGATTMAETKPEDEADFDEGLDQQSETSIGQQQIDEEMAAQSAELDA